MPASERLTGLPTASSGRENMKFIVLTHADRLPAEAISTAYLLPDNWNDWYTYVTMFWLTVFDEHGVRVDPGSVKIGKAGLTKGTPDLDQKFDVLRDGFFSLGQDENYYQSIRALGPSLAKKILVGLRDCAFDLSIYEKYKTEDVMQQSLMRSVSVVSLTQRFNRLANGNDKLSSYSFNYNLPVGGDGQESYLSLEFGVQPISQPPTNLHVLIGRNGVGKTRLLDNMSRALLGQKSRDGGSAGFFTTSTGAMFSGEFAGVVQVSFSAFDVFNPLRDGTVGENHEAYTYVGLKKNLKREASQLPHLGSDNLAVPPDLFLPKSTDDLAAEFVASVSMCLKGARKDVWKDALRTLESDPLFAESDITAIADFEDPDGQKRQAAALFEAASSGHRVVLLMISRLVESVEERTLVLIDEPEAHLHPPLLAAFMRALSDLMLFRNGLAIIATHSPVVLQEVPKQCVWVLQRSGFEVSALRPEVETFAENIGILTREVFGLEVVQSGFHRRIEEALSRNFNDLELANVEFEDRLGGEGRAILRSLAVARSHNA